MALHQHRRLVPSAHREQRFAQPQFLIERRPLLVQNLFRFLVLFGDGDDVHTAGVLLGVGQFLGGRRVHFGVAGSQPPVDVLQVDDFVLEQQGRDDEERARRGQRVGRDEFEAQHFAQCQRVGHVGTDQRHEEPAVQMRTAFEGFQEDVQHSVGIQVEASDQRLDHLTSRKVD